MKIQAERQNWRGMLSDIKKSNLPCEKTEKIVFFVRKILVINER
jgi:hypothetical protein